jgi:rhodanese-related sulfurtransferase
VPQVSAKELTERRQRGERLVVIDVRTEEEFFKGHVPDAYHIPGGDLLLDLPSLPEIGDHTIVVSCAGRTRGILGAEMLRMAGVSNVFALENGGMGWRLAGEDLQEGAGRSRPGRGGSAPAWVEQATARLAQSAQIRTLAVQDFMILRESGEPFYAVDIRVPREFQEGRISGSISIPAGQFALQHENFLAVRRAPVVMIADDAIRPVWAAALGQSLGFPRVFVLDGGIPAWANAGNPIDRGVKAAPVFGLSAALQQVSPIDRRALSALLERDAAHVLDVRGSGEFVSGHIPGSRWLARGRI